MHNLETLIFDVDGTLAETERDGHRIAFNKAFVEAGLDWHWSVALYGELLKVSGGKQRIHHYQQHYQGDKSLAAESPDFVADLHANKNRLYADLLEQSAISLRPGIKRLMLEAKKQGIRLSIATTSSRENVIILLQRLVSPDAVSWFDVIITADEVSDLKPSAAVYHRALKELSLAPQQCLVFEDSENGLKASIGAELRTIVTVNEYTRSGAYQEAALVLNHLGEPETPYSVLDGQFMESIDTSQAYVDMTLLRKLQSL